MPGKRGGVIGNSHDIIRQEDEEAIFERWAAENIHIVQRFDVGLEQDVLGGTATGLGESYQKHWGVRRNDASKALPSMGFRCAALLSF